MLDSEETKGTEEKNSMTLYVEAINTMPKTIAGDRRTTTIDIEITKEDAEALAILFQNRSTDSNTNFFRVRLTGRLVIP